MSTEKKLVSGSNNSSKIYESVSSFQLFSWPFVAPPTGPTSDLFRVVSIFCSLQPVAVSWLQQVKPDYHFHKLLFGTESWVCIKSIF